MTNKADDINYVGADKYDDLPSSAELEKEMHKLGRELYNAGVFKQTINGSSTLTVEAHVSMMLALFQAREQQLLTELYGIYQNEPTIQKGYEALVAELFTKIEKYREGL